MLPKRQLTFRFLHFCHNTIKGLFSKRGIRLPCRPNGLTIFHIIFKLFGPETRGHKLTSISQRTESPDDCAYFDSSELDFCETSMQLFYDYNDSVDRLRNKDICKPMLTLVRTLVLEIANTFVEDEHRWGAFIDPLVNNSFLKRKLKRWLLNVLYDKGSWDRATRMIIIRLIVYEKENLPCMVPNSV